MSSFDEPSHLTAGDKEVPDLHIEHQNFSIFKDEPTDFEIRATALMAAATSYSSNCGWSHSQIINRAKKFEEYLRGSDD